MPIYQIAGIIIDFDYHYDEFFKDNIEKYQVSDEIKADYKIKTEILKNIEPPLGVPTIFFKNRSIIEKDHKKMIVVTDEDGSILELIEHTNDYKNVSIKLSTKLKQRLAEKEYLLSGLMFIELATLEYRLAIHGSAFMVQGEAIIIAASSGMGKSTHANYWKDIFDTYKIINDDRPLIFAINKQFYVSGSPWSGKTKSNNNITVPLKAIVFYHQGMINQLKDLSIDSKLEQLLNHALRPRGEALMDQALKMMDDIIRYCPLVEYHAINEPSSVYPLYQKIYGGKDEN